MKNIITTMFAGTASAITSRHDFTLALMAILFLGMTSCSSSDDEKDMVSPSISTTGIVANPINCQVYHTGETIYFDYLFEDNEELGSFNIEIHGNFDHHSHSTEADDHDNHDHDGDHDHDGECPHSEVERTLPDTAWVFNQSYAIPAGMKTYHAKVAIPVPKHIKCADKNGHPGDSLTLNTRPGDYHFMVRLTDKAAWQTLKAVAIKIEH